MSQKIILWWAAAMYALPGLALVFIPQPFYDWLADFPPFNRHYMGDAGVFSFAIGVGLIWAARRPAAHTGVIGIAALAAILHVFNHLYDDVIIGHETVRHMVLNTLPLIMLALALMIVWRRNSKNSG